MNRYPLWINLLICFTLVIGVYTLPNFFGEVPAIQVSAAKSTVKVDDDLQKRVEGALKAANIANDGVTLDAASLKVPCRPLRRKRKNRTQSSENKASSREFHLERAV